MPEPIQPENLLDVLTFRIADPGTFARRSTHVVTGEPLETVARWTARAVAAGLEDGTLGYVLAAELDERDSTISSLRDDLDFQTKAAFANQADVDRLAASLDAVREAAHRQQQRFNAERAQWQAEIANLVNLIAPYDDEAVISIGFIRKALREGPAPVPGSSRRAQEPAGGVLAEVAAERQRQDAKWGEQNHPDGTARNGQTDRELADASRRLCQAAAAAGMVTWRHILDEELREAYAETDPAKLRAELLQVAAVAAAWVEAIDRRTEPAGESQASEPADVGKCPQCGKQTRSYRRGCSWCGFGRPASEPVGECGPDCSEGHTYMAGCAIKPPDRAFLGERPCGRRGCPCGGTQ